MKKIFPKIALLISCLAICDSCSKTNSNNNSTVSTSPTESSLSETNKDMTSYFEFIDVGGYGYSVKLKSFPDDGIVIIPKNYSRKDVISIEDHCFSDFTDLKKVVIPDSVISIGDSAFKGCSSLTSITIPNNVTSIGWNAFEGCSSLSSIIIPNGVTRIEYSVFKDCSSLTSITIPNSVTSIDDDAFYGCSSLTSITIPASVKSIGSWAFNRCSSLTSITIPNSVTSIDDDAFLGCSSLKYNEYGNCLYLGNEENLYLVLVEAKDKIIKEATISNNTRFILSDAFRGCSSLTSITIPSSVTSIGSGAFNRCSSLSLIKIPKSVTSIGSYAFYYCDNLIIYCEANSQPYNWDSDWNYSDRPVYWETNMVKDGIKYLIENGNAMATGCINELSNNVIIPATITIGGTTYNVTSVGDNAFSSCKSLVSVTIPNSITSIGNDAFSGCRSLENVYYNGTIENWCKINLSSYYTNPMYNAKHFYMLNTNNEYEELTSIVIPNTITSIGNYQFQGFNNIASILIPNSVKSIGRDAFVGCISLTIYCEASSKPDGWNSDWNGSNRTVYWGVHDDNYVVQDGIIYGITDGKAVITGHTNKTSDVVVPATITVGERIYNVTSIENETFSGCSSLTSISIPSSVTNIGYHAFYDCSSLTSIVIPSSVNSIGRYAFYDCSALTIYCEVNSQPYSWNSDWNDSYRPVYWGVSQKDIIYQNGLMFLIIDGNAVVTGHTNELSNNVVIPETITIGGTTYNVTSIGDSAFSSCSSLTSVTIPNSVTRIGNRTFDACSSLTSITIPNNVTNIGSDAFKNCSSLTIYCEASSKPNGWDSNWNYYRPVYWEIRDNNCLIQDEIVYVIKDENAVVTGHTYELSNNVVIPETITIGGTTYNVTSIGDGAFECCSYLTSITIPNSITSIEGDAFYNCNSLTSLTIEGESKLTSIGYSAFSNCYDLTSITIPNSVTSIGSDAFRECSSLTIYCEASSKPSGWNFYWNYSDRPVYWGK